MIVDKSIDIEDELRTALSDYITAYCRPLPEEYDLPNILITQVGGGRGNRLDRFEVVIDARAALDASALDYLNTAVAVLEKIAKDQTSAIRHVTINSLGSWGVDPVRPDLKMCSARLSIVAHPTIMEVETNV